MKVLFFGDLAATGFGTVTSDLGRRLLDRGLDVRFVSQNDLDQLEEPFTSRTVNLRSLVPVSTPLEGTQGVAGAAQGLDSLLDGTSTGLLYDGRACYGWRPDAAIILGDYASVRFIVGPYAKAFAALPTFHYVPIEGVGLPPRWAGLYKIVRPVAMSQFGADVLERLIGTRPPVIYHGVDTEAFQPIGSRAPIFLSSTGKAASMLTTKADCKRAWAGFLAETNQLQGPPPGKWLLRTDRHMPRKRHNALIRSLLPTLERNPDWALVLHCAARDEGGDLRDAQSKVPAELRRQVLITDQFRISRDLLRSLYCAADLYVSISAEGFGLTVAEALACGVPAVGIDYSAVPEVIGPAGATVPIAGLLDNEFDHYWAAIDEQQFAAKVEFLMTHQTKREDLGRRGPAHIAATFSWDDAADRFTELLRAAVPAEVAA
jgi:glycosyltransferase involved in cell wall biosynthesis